MELKNIKYLSDKRIAELNKSGITSVEELAKFFPRDYLDMTEITPVSAAYNNDRVLTLAKVETEPRLFTGGRVKYVKVYCSQGKDTFDIVWFNQPYVLNKIQSGKEYMFFGRVQNKLGLVSMTNPVFEEAENNAKLKGLVPVYPIRTAIPQSVMRYCALSAVKLVDAESEIPEELQRKYSLSPLKKAYFEVHSPSSASALKNASERIALEEYFSLISAFKVIKGDKKRARTINYTCSASDLKEFIAKFPFEFTSGQKAAVNEIFKDMTAPTVMNRIIQGDVGCGKTAVSLCAVYMAVKSGFQAAFLAPTEVLARQNYNLAVRYFGEDKVALLAGSLSAKEKSAIKKKIKSGEAAVVVGTHAVIQESVSFKNLTLCVCDEQQRFGVAQRSALTDKAVLPDTLVMSATPIPRTLSLVFYGDLDVSTIPDKPKARAAITTRVVPENKYSDMLGFIDKEIKKGNRAYFVCPKIEGDDEGTLISVKELYNDLSSMLPDVAVGLLHGKMKETEKQEIMNAFKRGDINALCSTTVIEVGIDVPEATVMVIYNAERFGLSQLHQLRGRVGRFDRPSYCFLLSGSDSEIAKKRLSIIKNCSDGFQISEADYDIRGGGDFLGERQSGKILSDLGNLKYSSKTIFFAKALSDEAFDNERNVPALRIAAARRYERLKDVTLN